MKLRISGKANEPHDGEGEMVGKEVEVSGGEECRSMDGRGRRGAKRKRVVADYAKVANGGGAGSASEKRGKVVEGGRGKELEKGGGVARGEDGGNVLEEEDGATKGIG